jgi:DNA polymerase-3 subunit delta'
MNFVRIGPERHDSLDGVPDPAEHALLVGHAEQSAMLAASHRAGRLHHGLLFSGPAGIGKATLAFRLAYHLLAHPRGSTAPETIGQPDPANPAFRQIAQAAHPSVLHLTRPFDEKTKKFKTVLAVDEVRRVSRFLSMTAHDGGWRVVVVDPADDLNTAAANALLKNLEEPPPRALFVLVTHQPGRLLPTIRSRCQLVPFSPLADAEVAAVFAGLGLSLPADTAQRAAPLERAEGSVRAAIMLTEYGGLEIAGAVDEILAARRFDVSAATKVADAVTGREREQQFDLFRGHLEQVLSTAATERAWRGDAARADTLAAAWSAFGRSSAEAEAYNLDRRQHVTASLMRAHAALHQA